MPTAIKLVLYGQLSYIDDKNKLHFAFLDEEYPKTRQSLNNVVDKGTHPPFDEDEFWVILPSICGKQIPDDITKKIGLRLKVTVETKWYTFTSPQTYNKGEKISGFRLVLDDISKII